MPVPDGVPMTKKLAGIRIVLGEIKVNVWKGIHSFSL